MHILEFIAYESVFVCISTYVDNFSVVNFIVIMRYLRTLNELMMNT